MNEKQRHPASRLSYVKCKVSVAMLTYNHEKYIAEAIESVLKQKVNFKYEIVIGEDCSTDKTREIILRYKEKYPDIFTLILQEHNVGCIKNELNIYEKCTGEYIAYLDGDDYWLLEDKLQNQVDFLDNNKDYSACYTDDALICDDEQMEKDYHCSHIDFNTYDDFFTKATNMPTASFVMRNYFLTEKDYSKIYLGPRLTTDQITFCWLLKFGKIKYLDVKSCVYRYLFHGKESYTSQDPTFKFYDYVLALRNQQKIVPKEYKHYLKKEISYYDKKIISLYAKDKRFWKSFSFWLFKTSMIEKIRILYCRMEISKWEVWE